MLPSFEFDQNEALRQFLLISLAKQANREGIGAFSQDSRNHLITRLTAAAIEEITDITAYGFSPVLTGTLRASHRADIKILTDTEDELIVLGFMYLDPHIVNPILGGRPAVYGLEVRERNDWIGKAASAHGDRIVQRLGSEMTHSVFELMTG